MALLAFLAMGADGCEVEETKKQEQEPAAASKTEAEPQAEPEPASNPDGTYSLSCSYLLGDFTEGPAGYRFIGGGEVENTGNIGTITKVKFRWDVLGSKAITKTKTVRLRPGQKRSVNVTVPATNDQIDAHQAAEGDCGTKATMVDTFGSPIG